MAAVKSAFGQSDWWILKMTISVWWKFELACFFHTGTNSGKEKGEFWDGHGDGKCFQPITLQDS